MTPENYFMIGWVFGILTVVAIKMLFSRAQERKGKKLP